MAKGDQMNAPGMQQQQQQKQDQYSVMHKIMDAFGPVASSSVAPSNMPMGTNSSDMGGRMSSQPVSFAPNQGFLAGDNFQQQPLQPVASRQFGSYGGDFRPRNMNTGTTYGGSSLAPMNPQDMIRKTMQSNGTIGQMQ